MKRVFTEVYSLDKKCYERYFLSEDILMEHASLSIAKFIKKSFSKNSSILIVCGFGNNGADGIALARLLYKKYKISLYIPYKPNSHMAKLQYKRAKALGIREIKELKECEIVVDCLFGSGLNKELDKKSIDIIEKLNSFNAYKIACDIPSGLNAQGNILKACFKANTTITMGAYKIGLFSDIAKDYVGKIRVTELGVDYSLYENESENFLLEWSDMKLPFRNIENSNKGSFGHLAVIVGEKKGASILSCKSAFSFGSGLVSAICEDDLSLPNHIMSSKKIPKNTTAIAIGMGLGKFKKREIEDILNLDIPKVIDADLFYSRAILIILEKESVLTPHPKEFCSLLKLCNITDICVEKLQQNRFKYAKLFSEKYPNVVLYLKGANSIIAQKGKLYINKFGTSMLSKGGSGDVLAGLIASLLAQKYDLLEATITASLAHSLAVRDCNKNSYALKPQDLINNVEKLKLKIKAD